MEKLMVRDLDVKDNASLVEQFGTRGRDDFYFDRGGASLELLEEKD
jgi:hypothetical protein